MGNLAFVVRYERTAIEYQLILSANQIDINNRQQYFAAPDGRRPVIRARWPCLCETERHSD